MLQYILAILLGLACPKHTTTTTTTPPTAPTTMSTNDTGGEGGHIPNKPK